MTWHRAIFPWGNPQSIFAADAFHNRVRDGSEWFHTAIGTRKAVCSFANDKSLENRIVIRVSRLDINVRGQALGLLVFLSFIHHCTST